MKSRLALTFNSDPAPQVGDHKCTTTLATDCFLMRVMGKLFYFRKATRCYKVFTAQGES